MIKANSTMQEVNRFNDEDLAMFKALIEKKLAKANSDLDYLQEQIQDTTDNREDSDPMDDTSSSSDLEMLYTMAGRGRKHITDLENALLRIRSRSYGICVVTGELIDKKRLLAVPTTTKSLAAKNMNLESLKKEKVKVVPVRKEGERKIISKVITPKKTQPVEQDISSDDDFDMEDDDDLFDDVMTNTVDFDDETHSSEVEDED